MVLIAFPLNRLSQRVQAATIELQLDTAYFPIQLACFLALPTNRLVLFAETAKVIDGVAIEFASEGLDCIVASVRGKRIGFRAGERVELVRPQSDRFKQPSPGDVFIGAGDQVVGVVQKTACWKTTSAQAMKRQETDHAVITPNDGNLNIAAGSLDGLRKGNGKKRSAKIWPKGANGFPSIK